MHKFQALSILTIALLLPLCGCGNSLEKQKAQKIAELEATIQLNKSIGEFAEVFTSDAVLVEGFGIVMGLNGNGSSECPSGVKSQMVKLIQRKLNTNNKREALELLKSRDNAVVRIYGIIPEGSPKGTRFDVVVEALEATQTTSLEGGTLFDCDLVPYTRVGVGGARELAKAKGAIYIENIDSNNPNKTKGVIIGGGSSLESPSMTLGLYEPNFMLTSLIRNMVNQRFGSDTANAKTAGLILISPPEEYKNEQEKLAKLIKAIYLPQNDQAEIEKIKQLASTLHEKNQLIDSEIGLETIGRRSLAYIKEYSNSDDDYVKLRAARVMLNLRDQKAAWILRKIALDKKSPYRAEAIEAIACSDDDTIKSTLRTFIDDEDFDVRRAAYKALKKAGDISITTESIGGNFSMESIISSGQNVIYVRRQKNPAIILFGKDINAIQSTFITSRDSSITISANPSLNKLSIMRKHPTKAGIIGPIKTGFSINQIIRAMGESPNARTFSFKRGLGLNFAEITSLLELMCKSGVVNAKFIAQPLADIDQEIKGRLR